MSSYIKDEQPDTDFDLSDRIKHIHHTKPDNDIIVEFDAKQLNSDNFQILVSLSEILQQSGEVGVMEYEIFKFDIQSLKTYEKELILVK
jgi:hypothetical protein